MSAEPQIENFLAGELPKGAPPTRSPAPQPGRKFWAIGEDHYRLAVSELGVTLEVDRLRREHSELIGELSVHCELAGARTVDGTLSIADFNLSSARARTDRAKLLASRASTRDLDWTALVEELCQRVLKADRDGKPAVDLRTLDRPDANDSLSVEGITLPKLHPTILFGDGGTGKSYLALLLAGRIAEMGIPVAIFDWELAGEDHRERLERLFPDGMPRILYARCERPLVYEVDRLRRIVREHAIQFSVYDSIAFACDGPPESAEIAGKYFRAVRQIGGGSLHVAHVSKGENADKKPFGSTFWHNGARSTWYVQLAEGSIESGVLQIGLFNRKSNLGRISPPLGFSMTFNEDTTVFRHNNVANTPELAGHLSVRQRMAHQLRRGSMDPERLAEEIDADVETVKRTMRRYKSQFIVIEGGRVGLLETRTKCPDTPDGLSVQPGGGHTPP